MGRFISRDVWDGDYTIPMSYNTWLYGYGNPVNYVDPGGLFPCDTCVYFRSSAGRKWCDENCCGSRWEDVINTQTWDYDGIGAAKWAVDNMSGFQNECSQSCTEFVSTALAEGGGAPTTEEWNSELSCFVNNPWVSTDAFYDFLINKQKFNILNVDVSDPNRFFQQNYNIPPGSIVFYDTGTFSSVEFPGIGFSHAAITTGNTVEGFFYKDNQLEVDFSGQYGPEVADHNGYFSASGPHLLYQTSRDPIQIVIALKP